MKTKVKEIVLLNGEGLRCYVDEKNYNWLVKQNWSFRESDKVVKRHDSHGTVYMKVEIIKKSKKRISYSDFVIHEDGNPLNLTKKNLKIVNKNISRKKTGKLCSK